MSTTTTAKAAKPAPESRDHPFSSFQTPDPDAGDVPAAFREYAEKSVSNARDAYEKLRSVADDANSLVAHGLETARESAFTIGVKALDATKANTDASLAFARDLVGAKDLSEVIELQSAFARKQFDAFTAQFKQFQDLTEELVTRASKPVTDQVEKTLKDLKVV